MIQRNFTIASSLFILAVGCQTPAEKQANERSEASKEIREAGVDARDKIVEAKKDLTEAEREYGQEISDANKKVTDEVKEATKEIGEADEDAQDDMDRANKDADRDATGNRYARFEMLKNESETAFATRADAAVVRLQTDLDAARARTKASTSKDLSEDLTDAANALAEAKKDLGELRTKSGKVFDDGRLGVGMAINKAQRELGDAYDEMAALKM